MARLETNKKSVLSIHEDFARIKEHSAFVLPLLSIAFLALIILLIVVPSIREITRLTQQINAERKLRDSVVTKNNKLSQIDFNKFVADFTELTAALPDDQNITSLVATAQRLANENGLRFDDLKLDLKAVPVEKVDFDMTVTGNISYIYKMLETMSKGKRILIPSKVELRQSDSNSNFIAIVSASAPFQVPPAYLDSVDTPIKEYDEIEKKLIESLRSQTTYSGDSTDAPSPNTKTKTDPFQ